MTVLQVPDIHSHHCVIRINDALTDAGLAFEVSAEGKTISVDGGREAVTKAMSRLDELGYDAVVLKRSK